MKTSEAGGRRTRNLSPIIGDVYVADGRLSPLLSDSLPVSRFANSEQHCAAHSVHGPYGGG